MASGRLVGVVAGTEQEDQGGPVFTLVSGTLPLDQLPRNPVAPDDQCILLQFDVDLNRPGRYELQIDDTSGWLLWLNRDPLPTDNSIDVALPAGHHRVTIAIDPSRHTGNLAAILLNKSIR